LVSTWRKIRHEFSHFCRWVPTWRSTFLSGEPARACRAWRADPRQLRCASPPDGTGSLLRRARSRSSSSDSLPVAPTFHVRAVRPAACLLVWLLAAALPGWWLRPAARCRTPDVVVGGLWFFRGGVAVSAKLVTDWPNSLRGYANERRAVRGLCFRRHALARHDTSIAGVVRVRVGSGRQQSGRRQLALPTPIPPRPGLWIFRSIARSRLLATHQPHNGSTLVIDIAPRLASGT